MAALRGAGHEPVILARSTGVELVSGAGLADALAGVDAVIDASNISAQRAAIVSEFFEATSRNLMRAAARSGVSHIVALSIIGIDRVPYGYYKGKVRQEEMMRDSPVPVSVLRAAQRQVLEVRDERRRVLEVRLPGATGRALATGGGLPGPGVTLGAQTFAGWLRSQAAHPSSVSPATGAS